MIVFTRVFSLVLPTFKKKKKDDERKRKKGSFTHSSLMLKSLKTSAITLATPWGRISDPQFS